MKRSIMAVILTAALTLTACSAAETESTAAPEETTEATTTVEETEATPTPSLSPTPTPTPVPAICSMSIDEVYDDMVEAAGSYTTSFANHDQYINDTNAANGIVSAKVLVGMNPSESDSGMMIVTEILVLEYEPDSEILASMKAGDQITIYSSSSDSEEVHKITEIGGNYVLIIGVLYGEADTSSEDWMDWIPPFDEPGAQAAYEAFAALCE